MPDGVDPIIREAFDAPTGTTVTSGGAGVGKWRTAWSVTVDGKNLTDRLNPYLTSIEVNDRDGTATDQARLVFDDTRSQVVLPKAGGIMTVSLAYTKVFEGAIDEIKSTAARGQGRLLTITAKGFDANTKVKAPLDFHKDDATFKEFLEEAGEKAGITTVKVAEEFASIKRSYWSADIESFIHLGERFANEFGGTFKIRNTTAIFAPRGGNVSVSGLTMETVTGTYGKNLLRWDISPFVARPRHTKSRVNWYDRKKAKYEEKIVEIDDADIKEATTVPAYTSHDEDAADKKAKGKKTKSQRESGEGTVVILLEPKAQAEGTFKLVGARPGVDGEFRIASVRHIVTRKGGSESQLDLKRPETKEDERKPTANNKSNVSEGPWTMEQARRSQEEYHWGQSEVPTPPRQ